MPPSESMAEKLRLSDLLRRPVMRAAVEALRLPAGSRGLDVGCGIGSLTRPLVQAVGSDGRVAGIDLSGELLRDAHCAAAAADLRRQASYLRADMTRLPFGDGRFDWVWSVDCVGFAGVDPVPLLRELARVVRPGGTVAWLVWSSQQLLPGHPLLEARLNATRGGTAPFRAGQAPPSHFLRALDWLVRAGLEEPRARTFAGDMHAPLDESARQAMLSLIDMRWGDPRSELSPGDREEYDRICRPESPEFIVDVPGYYSLFTYSMFSGRVAPGEGR